MTVVTSQKMSLEEYLIYDDGTDTRHELVDGVLVEMGTENPVNNLIASFLFSVFLGMGIPYYRLVIGRRLGVSAAQATARQPDFIVHTEASLAAILADQILLFQQANPALVVEVVSNSEADPRSRKRDYQEKRAEYEARGIPEYWIVDPIKAVVLVLTLEQGQYREQRCIGPQVLKSSAFPTLTLTAAQVLTAGR
jgi:Uma2 family endonuclease